MVFENIAIPLKTDADGVIRVGGTRVTLESVIADYQEGATPLQIVEDYPVLKAADVFYVIGYYLDNQAEVDAYIAHQTEANEALRREWEKDHPPTLNKAALLARQPQ